MAKKGKKANKQVQKPNILAGVREELRQVTWPTREETMQLTITVVIISLIVALYVGIIDFSLARIQQLLLR